jgi:hypothetical protein
VNELERYIREQFGQDRQELEDLRQLAADALPTVVVSWKSNGKAWPYLFGAELTKRYSFSTNAMILFMLSVVLEHTKSSSLLPSMPQNSHLKSMLLSRLKRDLSKDYEAEVKRCFDQGLRRLFQNVTKEYKKNGRLTHSSTYGDNDVLTLTWLTELLRVAQNPKSDAVTKLGATLHRSLERAVKVLRTSTIEKAPTIERLRLRCLFYRERLNKGEAKQNGEKDSLEHPFPLVRLVQLLEARHGLHPVWMTPA